ncbi:hypothetical protein E3N88_07207 [Mikania micrantha]|uniref:Retrotransposon gag domain-containing protein n=1 Tax=Mikania micrantha TaxID=192012 RepID=A0A5N6PRL1_9ASTR|nr:hypothetical protein E3N88_07207 [Mikania micrantha]
MADNNNDSRNSDRLPTTDDMAAESRRRVNDIVAQKWIIEERVPPYRYPGDTSPGHRLPPLGVPLEQAFTAHVACTRREIWRSGELSDEVRILREKNDLLERHNDRLEKQVETLRLQVSQLMSQHGQMVDVMHEHDGRITENRVANEETQAMVQASEAMLNAWVAQFIEEPPQDDGPQFEVNDLEEGDFDEDLNEDPEEDDADGDSDRSNGSNGKGCSFKSFLNCHPHKFKSTEGVVGMLRWVEKVESVFAMCECADENRVKFATGTLEGPALTWWNTHVQTLGLDGANSMSWTDFTRILQEEYCLRDEIRKLEAEFWVLKMVGSEIEQYCTRFHEF